MYLSAYRNRVLKTLLLMTLFFLSSCTNSSSMITVHTDYLSHENLASYYVKTPDPRLNNPSIGQRLIVSWSIPKKLLLAENLHLKMTIRFRNREESVKIIPISERAGTYVYALLNEDYISTKGVLTYKIDLIGDNSIIERWLHQIWTELILIEQATSQEENENLSKDFEEEI
jgi:hypothetical protein